MHWRRFWAKTLPDEGESRRAAAHVHPLWAHLLDVACVAERLWAAYLPDRLRADLTAATGLAAEAEAGRWLSLLVGLHDAGKAIPSFQALHDPSWEALAQADPRLHVNDPSAHRLHHGHATVPILFAWIDSAAPTDAARLLGRELATFVGLHHGYFYQPCHLDIRRRFPKRVQGWGKQTGLPAKEDETRQVWEKEDETRQAWEEAQQALVEAVAEAWREGDDMTWSWPQPPPSYAEAKRIPAWLVPFAGWATWADWLGSMQSVFTPCEDPHELLGDYLARAEARADEVIRLIGAREPGIRTSDIHVLFPFIQEPRPLQALAGTLDVAQGPTLTIMEAPTGEGKTEAALLLAARQQVEDPLATEAGGRGGVYVAMPTQATSNGLYPRLAAFLWNASLGDGAAPRLALLHGGADLHPSRRFRADDAQPAPLDGSKHLPSAVYDDDDETQGDDGVSLRPRRWFLPRKRGLLARHGVGTVDQAFLGVLYSRHFFVRLFGLAGKTVVFDEVHAYDAYMNRLFERLLAWLKAVGASVVILSATLPARARRNLLKAWGATEDASGGAAYPALWHATGGDAPVRPRSFSVRERTPLTVLRLDPERPDDDHAPPALVDRVAQAVERGACVGIIVNTVARAQAIYHDLKALGGLSPREDGQGNLWLLHARFPHGRRADRECDMLGRFGKKGRTANAGKPAVVVATQVAEQSLDFDTDVMISDLAPIDLLLQRAGRLHRFDLDRPPDYRSPTLHVLCPDAEPGALPALDAHGLGAVYDRLTLYRTWWRLRQDGFGDGATWTLVAPGEDDGGHDSEPATDYRALVEAVYDERDSAPADLGAEAVAAWKKAIERQTKEASQHRDEAEDRRIKGPGGLHDMLSFSRLVLDDDEDPSVHRDLRALTRLGPPSVQAVCLHAEPGTEPGRDACFLDPRCRSAVPFDALVSHDEAGRLAARARVLEQVVRLSGHRLADCLAEHVPAWWTRAVKDVPALHYHVPLVFVERAWSCDAGIRITYDDEVGLRVHYPWS
jgi:CRISPR-associated endonuclease/helicase Cas3